MSAPPVVSIARLQDEAPRRLQPLDRQAILGLVEGDDAELGAWAAETVSSLAGAERNEARVLLLAQDIAAERLRRRDLQRNLDERICANDAVGIALFDRLLNSSTRRLCTLIAAHQASCSVGHRAAVLVGHADEVRVGGE